MEDDGEELRTSATHASGKVARSAMHDITWLNITYYYIFVHDIIDAYHRIT